MGEFLLPSLPPDFVPNFLTQPGFITNDTNIPEDPGSFPPLQQEDPSREDRFPRDSPFLDELEDALNNLAQHQEDCTLSKEQWMEVAALYSQAMRKGLTKFTNSIGAASFTRNLPLESHVHFIELSKNIESINRYFQLPYDESMSINYCHKCVTAEGTTPTHWQTQLEICGHNATVARGSITNQYIQTTLTQMNEWYESIRASAHDQIVLKLTNDSFAPETLTADPRVIEWSNRVYEDAQTRRLLAIDTKAKQDAEDHYQTALAQYTSSHEHDLSQTRDEFNQALLRVKNDHNIKLSEVEAKYQKEYQEMIDNAKRNRPVITDPSVITDPTARKKRRGSVSTINSPIVTKTQPFHMHANSNLDPDDQPTIAAPPSLPPPQPLDPMALILQKISKQFDSFTERLDKLETENKNTYTTWDDNPSQWNQPQNDVALAGSGPQIPYDKIDYDNPDMYDDPPNDHSFVGEYEPPAQTNTAPAPESEHLFGLEEPQVPEHLLNPDSDCVLLSSPPTPTPKNPRPPGLRPPERAQRVDFDSRRLASDSFGIPVGGLCKADGSISYSNANPSRNNRPKKPLQVPENVTPYSPDQLVLFSKDVIIAHALFAFQHPIPRKLTKPDVIKQYNIAVANSRKPGARQTTLSFASAAARPAAPSTRPRQTTPSTWSKSPSPPPRRTNPSRNNTTWVIRPRMRTQGLATRPFEGNADKLTEWYRQRLQANAGPNKPALTLLHGAWAPGSKSIFSLTFAGHVTLQTVRAYTALFLEKFDNEHIFHPGNNAMKKIALFDIPIKRDSHGNPQTRRQLFNELSRGGSLAGLHFYDGPTWTPKSTDDPDATSGVIHILVHDPSGSALGKFFNKPTFMYNKRIPSHIAIPPKPFVQCARCHRLGHDAPKCNRPSNARICHHCGSDKHDSNQHKYQCKQQHSGPTCDCPPRCFLC